MSSCRILCEDGQTKLVMHRMFYLPKQLTWVGFTQEKEVLEAQKRDRWVPKVGSMIFIPRMKGNFKVRVSVWLILEPFRTCRSAACTSCVQGRAWCAKPGVSCQAEHVECR